MEINFKLEIKKADITDVDTILRIGETTFVETFGHLNTDEDMKLYVSKHFTPEKIRKEMETPGTEFYLANVDGESIGYLKLNSGDAQTEKYEKDWLEIERFYIQSEYKRMRLGTSMMNFIIEKGINENIKVLWLGVWEKNYPAQRFYSQFGFEVFGKHDFLLGTDMQQDLLMRRAVHIIDPV